MQNGGFVNKIQGVRLSVAKIHRHVFENPGCIGVDDIDDITNFQYIEIDGTSGKYMAVEEIDIQTMEDNNSLIDEIDYSVIDVWRDNLLFLPNEWTG